MKIYTYDNKVMTIGGKWMEQPAQPGPGPGPTLPPYTIRLKYDEGWEPASTKGTWVQVSSSPNIWDLTYENSDWSQLFGGGGSLLEVIGANTTGVTNMGSMFASTWNLTTVALFDTSSVTDMNSMFEGCSSLTTVPLFDTSNVTNMQRMFYECTSLTIIPLFNTSKVTTMYRTFRNCYNVESGALALYQQASTQTTPPTNHSYTFYNCGRDTTTGAAERAQIPTSWGGTMT